MELRTMLLAVTLAVGAGSADAGSLRVVEEGADFVAVYDGGLPVLRYVRGDILAEGFPEDRRRSTYVHPLYGLDGRPLTEDFPKDHPHHRGVSWIWQRVTFDGITKDLWTLKGVRQKYDSHKAFIDESSRAVLVVSGGWFEDSTTRRILNESVTITIHPLRPEGRVIDWEIRLSAVDTPVEIGVSERGYSGFNVRFGPRSDTAITTSKGPVVEDCDRVRYAWADLSGRFGDSDRFDGVTVFDCRSNPRFPAGWTLRFYGVLNPAFTSTSTDHRIEPGTPLTLRYRTLVHEGKADPDVLHRVFREYDDMHR